ncbi:lactate utilization protein C [Kitasatospora sp. NPDC051853]|uniref:lactate utilization protein C n=1 Tax=Kitasatospora sp. NPDC051853 TaxID=3364058 RepID=UPI0037AD2D0E
MSGSRDTVLARIRAALADRPGDDDPGPVRRGYRSSHLAPGTDLLGLLGANLSDYRASVHRCTEAELPALIGRLLADRGARTVAVPAGLPDAWLSATDAARLHDGTDELTPQHLDTVDSVVTTCALAIAETGTLVLDTGPGQGRRALTLVPDHHICVVRPPQIVPSVPAALPLLDPTRPLTWISGPSATSDIELDRVEGVHGPRTLEVVILDGEVHTP